MSAYQGVNVSNLFRRPRPNAIRVGIAYETGPNTLFARLSYDPDHRIAQRVIECSIATDRVDFVCRRAMGGGK